VERCRTGKSVQNPTELKLSPDVAKLVRIARIHAEPVAIKPASLELLREMERLRDALVARYAGRSPGDIEGLGHARELYRSFRIDPTHTRPSSEALLRRLLQGKPFPQILNAVDLCNLLSLEFLLPLGLYDAERIQGPVVLRRGLPGESYAGIRKEQVSLEGRPVLEDSAGPFGNPTSDSLRTAITLSTCRLWLVIFAPGTFPRAKLEEFSQIAEDAMAMHLSEAGGRMESGSEIYA
jgi:DNA/RNA-binding domain of Phe-tRNA-synthetase-like protein